MLIAEMCQNHNGNLETLHEMTVQAANAGAWAAKIQTFFADDLSDEFKHDYDRLKGLEIDWDGHKKFVDWCHKYDIVPMTSVYSIKYASKLSKLGFRWVKIGSANSHDTELIKFYKMMGFKVIISTGGRPLKKISKLWPLEGVLHCVSKYPHSPYEASLLRMLEIKTGWHKSACGFSDHTDPTHRDWFLPSYVAMWLGASYIEKHFTILMPHQTKDGPVSIGPKKLKMLCDFAKLDKISKMNELDRKGIVKVLHKNFLPEQEELIEKYQGRWKKEELDVE